MELNQLLFHVVDLQATSVFYSKLGFQQTQSQEKFIEFKIGSFTLQFLTQSTDSSIDLGVASTNKQGVFVYLKVDKVDETYKEIISKGFRVSRDPVDRPWGKREFAIKDPNGVVLIFYSEVTSNSFA